MPFVPRMGRAVRKRREKLYAVYSRVAQAPGVAASISSTLTFLLHFLPVTSISLKRISAFSSIECMSTLIRSGKTLTAKTRNMVGMGADEKTKREK